MRQKKTKCSIYFLQKDIPQHPFYPTYEKNLDYGTNISEILIATYLPVCLLNDLLLLLNRPSLPDITSMHEFVEAIGKLSLNRGSFYRCQVVRAIN